MLKLATLFTKKAIRLSHTQATKCPSLLCLQASIQRTLMTMRI